MLHLTSGGAIDFEKVVNVIKAATSKAGERLGIPGLGTLTPGAPADIEYLINWAEGKYSGLFAPSGSFTEVSGVYNYRHYSATNTCLGVSSTDNRVYYRGADGLLQNEGPLTNWLPMAGCQ